MKKIMILAGEPSGDLHGSNLAIELKRQSPQIELFGIGGERMKEAGVKILFDLRDLAIIGLFDVIKNYSRLKKIQSSLLSEIRFQKPSLIILIDYPDFNLRFAKKAQKIGAPIIYYIAPQVWAWRKHRIKLIKKYIKKIFVIFKFEEALYKNEGVPVEFIGHPLLDIVKPSVSKEEFLKTLAGGRRPETGESEAKRSLPEGDKIIALLPGSRESLVKRLLPIMLKSAGLIHKKIPKARFLISKSPSVDTKIYEKALNKFDLPFGIVENKTYDIINASDLVITVSGTSTLETAILEKPMVIIYKLPIFEYLLAKPLLLLKNIGLVNIVAGETVVPELVQFKARPKNIVRSAVDILENKTRYVSIQGKLAVVKYNLYPDGAAKRAAFSILEFLEV